MPLDRRFADWVVGFRKHMSWTQRDLGARVGRDRVTIARWESCVTYPDAITRIYLNNIAHEEGYDAVPRKWS
jgi:transcriptional regulator with XRE-family HTH domain